jgi:hypothetical protein
MARIGFNFGLAEFQLALRIGAYTGSGAAYEWSRMVIASSATKYILRAALCMPGCVFA